MISAFVNSWKDCKGSRQIKNIIHTTVYIEDYIDFQYIVHIAHS